MAVLGRKKQAKVPPNGPVFRGVMRNKPGASQRCILHPVSAGKTGCFKARGSAAHALARGDEGSPQRMGGSRRRARPQWRTRRRGGAVAQDEVVRHAAHGHSVIWPMPGTAGE